MFINKVTIFRFLRRHKILKTIWQLFWLLLFMLGAGIIVYWWYDGVLLSKSEKLIDDTLVVTSDLGFKLDQIVLEGREKTDRDALLNSFDVKIGDSLLAVNLMTVNENVKSLPWVEKAIVRRQLPNKLVIKIVERKPIALWQDGDKLYLVDKEGKVLTDKNLDQFAFLKIISGDGAPINADTILTLLKAEPLIDKNMVALNFVGKRRWDITLNTGAVIKLPEDGIDNAIKMLAQMLLKNQLLMTSSIKTIDMRIPEKVIIELAKETKTGDSGSVDQGI